VIKSIKTNPNSAKGYDKGKIVKEAHGTLNRIIEMNKTWTKTTQKG
jgi:hypothetical protein